jgi:intracellular septation protein
MPLLKLVFEFVPLGVFFAANSLFNLWVATAALMVTTLISLVASRIVLKKLPVMPLVTGTVVLVFGGLTLILHDETFIKMKPTIVNLLSAGALAGGLFFGRSLIKIVLEDAIKLQDEGWRKLTVRWAMFFAFLAVLNEFVWRSYPTDTWVAFKSFGIMPLTFLFMMAQIGLLQKYQLPEDTADAPSQ